MKFSTSAFALLLFSTLLLSIGGCKYDPSKGLSWDADLLAPIATSNVSVYDLVKEGGLLEDGQDGLLNIVFRDTVFRLGVSNTVELPDTTLKQAVSLGTLELTSDTIKQKVSLGFLLRQLMKSTDPIQASIAEYLYLSHGSVLDIPSYDGLTAPPYDIDASQFFEYAEIESGDMSVTITNKLVVDLKNVAFSVKNKTLGNVIVRDTFLSIPKNTQQTRLYDMAGDTVESAMQGGMDNLDIIGETAMIDTNSYLLVALVAVKMRASTAIAAFPNQTAIDTLREVEYRFGGGLEITKIGLKTGKIKVDAYSTVRDTIQYLYQLSSAADLQGNKPTLTQKIPPAPENGSNVVSQVKTLENVVLDMTRGKGYNTYEDHIKVDLLSSGQVIEFDKTDSVFLLFGLVDMVPNYVEGYIGKDTIVLTGKKALDALKRFNVDNIYFEDPKMDVTFSNSIGADAKMELKNIRFNNTKTGNATVLNGSLVNSPQYLNGPRLPHVGDVERTVFSLNKSNSNLPAIISNVPDEVQYNVRTVANYSGSPGVRNNFLTDTSEISVFMDFELPIHGIVNNFVLTDTVNTDFSKSVKPENLDNVSKATLKLLLANQFPFQATVDAVFYDENWNVVETMASAFEIKAAIPDATGYVTTPVQSLYEKTFQHDQITRILQRGRHLGLRYRLDTQPNNTSVKIYSTYRITAKLIGAFTYGFGR